MQSPNWLPNKDVHKYRRVPDLCFFWGGLKIDIRKGEKPQSTNPKAVPAKEKQRGEPPSKKARKKKD